MHDILFYVTLSVIATYIIVMSTLLFLGAYYV